MARTKTYPEDLRGRLIDAAYELLRVDSTEDMSLRELAASCDTSTNAIYAIFGGKDPLIAEVVRLAKTRFAEAQFEVLAAEPTLGSFARSGRFYRNWARAHPGLYHLMFTEASTRDAGLDRDDLVLDPLRTMLTQLIAHDVLRSSNIEGLALSIWAAVHGFVVLEMSLWPQGSPDAERLYEHHLANMVQGILTPRAQEMIRLRDGN